ASLDPKTSVQILDLLSDIASELGLPVLLNIHNVSQARQFAQRIVGLRFGTIIFDGTPADLDEEALDRIYEGTAGTGDEDDWTPLPAAAAAAAPAVAGDRSASAWPRPPRGAPGGARRPSPTPTCATASTA